MREHVVTAARSLGRQKQGNALLDSNHSRSNAFQLTKNICSTQAILVTCHMFFSRNLKVAAARDGAWRCAAKMAKLTAKIKNLRVWIMFCEWKRSSNVTLKLNDELARAYISIMFEHVP